jgi:preprotein translocase subunit SecA
MFKGITRILGGDPIRRQLEQYTEIVAQINALEPQMRDLSDEALQAKTGEFKSRLTDGASLDELLPEAFAVVRETSVRTIGLRHFDIQLIGGIVLHEGRIAEMRTGEGKTLVATLPIYLNALQEQGVHLVTVNDYLARRDARWMGPVFDFLGLSVGVLQSAARTEGGRKALLYDPSRESAQEDAHQVRLVDRKLAYAADVTYGTNNEFGFDYLRDNMARTLEARSQRGHNFAILDEVDNILIDEARTPLIISGPAHEDPELYIQMAGVVKQLRTEDLEINERDRTVSLTEIGEDHVEQVLGMPMRDPDRPEDITPEQARLLGHLEQALRAEHLFSRNKQYVVQGGRVVIVDEFTGRLMPGRRWSDGLHQAVEAKEGVRVRQENVTYATVTLQNYFRMYNKLSGMTGTALTEAEEFNKIYNVDVTPLPMNLEFRAMQPETDLVEVGYSENGSQFAYYAASEDPEQAPIFWKRKDYPDVVFRTEEAKLRAVTTEILWRHVKGQPLLVGTTSVELSEHLSKRLRSEPLQRLALVMIVRDAYMEAHDIQTEGVRVEALDPLNTPIDDLGSAILRPMGKELGLSLNPTKVENLERLAKVLDLDTGDRERLEACLKGGINHNVLNAKKHTEESQIIEGAGALGSVTIATNMAGRGVDIVLGGSLRGEVAQRVTRVARDSYEGAGHVDAREEMARILRAGVGTGYGKSSHVERLERWRREFSALSSKEMGIYEADVQEFDTFVVDRERVLELGGLHVIGCVRHESRRIDNQLRGRAARQGDPGSSQFFLSLEDDLMRLFGGSQVAGLMQRLNIDDAMPIAHNIVNRTIEQAQSRVEGANFDTRKHLLEYDDVLNQQREVYYGQRNRIFTKEDLTEDIEEMVQYEVDRHVELAMDEDEGYWKLLAWLEETQPSLNLDSQNAYPSFMLRLLLDEMKPIGDPATLQSGLLDSARRALETQHTHLSNIVEQQMSRAIDRMEDQVRQRMEMADMAVEAAMLEAEELDADVDASELLRAIESAAGMRIKVGSEGMRQIRENPQGFRDNIPGLIEGALGLRVWAGLIQGIERRVGEPLGLDLQVSAPIDWDDASQHLHGALDQVWARRTERVLKDVATEVENALARVDEGDDALATRLLVRMSYGKEAYFDRKTHQRKARFIPRLSYAFAAAQLLENEDPGDVRERVKAHLMGAQRSIQHDLGRTETASLSAARLDELDVRTQDALRDALGEDLYEQALAAGSIASLPDELREDVILAIGRIALTRNYRGLILSVGDRLWIDYLTQMEALRTSIGLEAYGQRDPLVQYKSRAFDMFGHLLADMRAGVVSQLFRARTAARPQTIASAQPTAERQEPGAKEQAGSGKKKRKKRRKRRR